MDHIAIDMESLESEKWIKHKVCEIYRGSHVIGYTVTEQEADDICCKRPDLQWDKAKYTGRPKHIPCVTIQTI
jgi:hypothetical protein